MKRVSLNLLLAGAVCVAAGASPLLQRHAAHADFLQESFQAILPPANQKVRIDYAPSADPHEVSMPDTTTDTFSWSPSAGAVSYNVYLYTTKIASGITATSYDIGPGVPNHENGTFTVTAVDAAGNESIPSGLFTFINANGPDFNVTSAPDWNIPDHVVATGQWNKGKPRIWLQWHGQVNNIYNVLRDGSVIAEGVENPNYIDDTVNPGETHTYTVEASYPQSPSGFYNTAPSKPASATAPAAAPAFSATPIQITKIIPNDDSVKIFFKPVPGAVDYRVYTTANLRNTKYAGLYFNGVARLETENYNWSLPDELSIEENGLDPSAATDLIVEAVDKAGPFQTMDGFIGPGGEAGTSTNGQGDPSNVPNAIARSAPVRATFKPFVLTGKDAFYDNFRNEQPLVDTSATIGASFLDTAHGSSSTVTRQENNKWTILGFDTDPDMTRNFFMGNHFMDTVYDGPSYLSAFSHNNNSANVIEPKGTADISNGGTLHVTMEVDAHMQGRKWTDILIGGAGDTLINPKPTKICTDNDHCGYPTASGYLFDWDIFTSSHAINLFRPDPKAPGVTTKTDLITDTTADPSFAQSQPYLRTLSNSQSVDLGQGTQMNIDNRSKFDLYLSKNKVRIVETRYDGKVINDISNDLPLDLNLPWNKLQVYFTHEVYHTGNARPETISYNPEESYNYDYRPFADERHWDNMGFEVLNTASGTPNSPDLTYDLDGDGGITITDIILAVQAFNGSPNQAALRLWPTSGNPSLSGIIHVIQAYNGN